MSIITKREKWGSPPLKQTTVVIKLANGETARPIGLLDDAKIKVFGLTFVHTFAIMNFGKDPNSYDCIIGRPFMRMANMVHDCPGQNRVYITQKDQTLRVDLANWKIHSMDNNPISIESVTTDRTSIPIVTESITTDRTSISIFKSSLPESPSGKEIAPLPECEDSENWMHILAMMDVLPQKMGGTRFKV